MRYIVETPKPVDQAVADLEKAIVAHHFSVMHVHNLQQTLEKKGYDLRHACCVLDVCNPQQAVKVLNEDMGMSVALPCRISVYAENGVTKLAMIKPTAVLSMLSHSPLLQDLAEQVESVLVKAMDEAVA